MSHVRDEAEHHFFFPSYPSCTLRVVIGIDFYTTASPNLENEDCRGVGVTIQVFALCFSFEIAWREKRR